MNLFILSWKYIKGKPLTTALNVLLLSFGIGIIVVLLLLSNQVQDKLTQNAKGIDLVVGAKGSPLQIILASIYHIDYPTGNIPLDEAASLSRNRLIRNAIPLALGDSYKSIRIVGTTASCRELYELELAEGGFWGSDYEVTLGAIAAETLGLKVGDAFFGEHGMAEGGESHESHAYKVAGILKPAGKVTDNLILTSVQSVWLMHDTHEEDTEGHEMEHADTTMQVLGMQVTREQLGEKDITSLLVQYRSPMAAVQLPRMVNSQSSMQAASPAFETARLFSLIGVGVDVVQGFAYLIIFMAGLSVFIALYNSLKERQYDLAVMRSLGASRLKLFVHITIEGILITFLGGVLGFVLGHGVIEILGRFFLDKQTGISGMVLLPSELYIIYISLILGIVASLIPAINAYKTDISKVLAKGA